MEEEITTTEDQQYGLNNLDDLALRIISLKEKIDHCENPKPETECMCKYCNAGRLAEKFTAIAVKLNQDAAKTADTLIKTAEEILKQNNLKKVPFVGIGTFIFQKDKAAIDYSQWESMSKEDKDEFYRNNAELFRKTEKIDLDKALLNEIIFKQGGEVSLFPIKSETHTFRFKK